MTAKEMTVKERADGLMVELHTHEGWSIDEVWDITEELRERVIPKIDPSYDENYDGDVCFGAGYRKMAPCLECPRRGICKSIIDRRKKKNKKGARP
ncbi:MAG TPA: hypothetical protein VGB78_05435 [Thermoplasmata archaeon]|jgi:hypothetical protein